MLFLTLLNRSGLLPPEHTLSSAESFLTLNINEHDYLQKIISKLKVHKAFAGTYLAWRDITYH